MKVSYFPGCTLKTKAVDLDRYARKSAEALGITLEEIEPKDLLWSQPDFDGTYFDRDNTRLVVGHTPTFLLRQTRRVPSIYHGEGNVIAVDCGAVFIGHGRLGCLCLDTGEEFYV